MKVKPSTPSYFSLVTKIRNKPEIRTRAKNIIFRKAVLTPTGEWEVVTGGWGLQVTSGTPCPQRSGQRQGLCVGVCSMETARDPWEGPGKEAPGSLSLCGGTIRSPPE